MAHTFDTELDAFELYLKAEEQGSKTSILGGPALPALGHAVSGAAGSVISILLTYPLSLVITRLQVQHQFRSSGKSKEANKVVDDDGDDDDSQYKGILDAIQKIYDEEGGIAGFYSGCGEDAVKTLISSFTFFLAHSFIRRQRLKARGGSSKRLPMHEELGVGMLAGAFSRLFATPLQNVVTRQQTAAMIAARSDDETTTTGSRAPPKTSARDIALQIYEERGILGFWSGYSASLVLTTNPAITFMTNEMLTRAFVRREQRSNPGPRLTFFLAAVSKVVASSITYPASLAKTRVQISKPKPKAANTEKSVDGASSKSPQGSQDRTIFHVILRIAKEEGFAALYEGLGAEVVKGFFAHGLTMLMKERIHKVVIQLYYLILHAMRKYPTPEELAKIASENVSSTVNHLGEKVAVAAAGAAGAAGKAMEVVEDISNRGKDKVYKTMDTVGHLYKQGKENEMDIVDEYVDTEDE